MNYDTGLKSSPGDKNIIIEALKNKDINNIDNNNLITISGRDTLIKFIILLMQNFENKLAFNRKNPREYKGVSLIVKRLKKNSEN